MRLLLSRSLSKFVCVSNCFCKFAKKKFALYCTNYLERFANIPADTPPHDKTKGAGRSNRDMSSG